MLNFKKIRIDKKMNQEEFSKLIGVSTRALSNYENGNLDITLKKMQEIAGILEIDFIDLINITQSSKNIVEEETEHYKINNIVQAQQKTIKILESQLEFANVLLEKCLEKKEN